MKFVLSLSMLVILLICHEALGIVKVEGECTSADFTESELQGCEIIYDCKKAENGTILGYAGTDCGLIRCSDGLEPPPGDNTKVFPDCCPQCP